MNRRKVIKVAPSKAKVTPHKVPKPAIEPPVVDSNEVILPTDMTVIQAVRSNVVGEHIFPKSKLEPMVLEWKRLMVQKREHDALLLLEQIIVSSTEMFARLAQHENFHRTVPVNQLIAAAQQKMAQWLVHWDPDKGQLFSWLSKCAKNAFKAELSKTLSHNKRIHSTDDEVTLERLMGTEDHSVDVHDAAADIQKRLSEITCRWAGHQERGCIRYLIECISADTHVKANAIRGASYAWGVSFEVSRFFYSWCIITLRQVLLDKAYLPMTPQDLIRCATYNTLVPDMMDTVGFEVVRILISVYGGQRVRFPSISDIEKARRKFELSRELEASSLDPDTVSVIAKRHGRTPRSAMEAFIEAAEMSHPRNNGEFYVYDPATGH